MMPTTSPISRGKRRVHPDHNDPATWLRRGEVAKLLGISRISVKYLDGTGGLHPIRDARGDYFYDPDEVSAYAVSHPRRGAKIYDDGDLACEAFKLFEAKKTRREVVIALRITCERADALWDEWRCNDFEAAARMRRDRAAQAEAEKLRNAAERRREATRQRSLTLLRAMRRDPEPR